MSFADVRAVVFLAIGLFVGLMVHEYAHALVSTRLGDLTPKQQGRLTLHPRPHLDPLGTVILPGLTLLPRLFGRLVFLPFAYAKPMEQSPWTLRRRNRDAILIASAGPAANLVLAFAAGGLLRVTAGTGLMGELLIGLLQTNVILAVFNILPIPPLDGSRVLARYLPARAAEVYRGLDAYGGLFILAIFFFLPGPINAFVSAIGNGICRLFAGGTCI